MGLDCRKRSSSERVQRVIGRSKRNKSHAGHDQADHKIRDRTRPTPNAAVVPTKATKTKFRLKRGYTGKYLDFFHEEGENNIHSDHPAFCGRLLSPPKRRQIESSIRLEKRSTCGSRRDILMVPWSWWGLFMVTRMGIPS